VSIAAAMPRTARPRLETADGWFAVQAAWMDDDMAIFWLLVR